MDGACGKVQIFCKFCEGGDSQLNDLIWYSWLGGIIIGTMIGSNMVLDEVSRAGPRNVVITGRYPFCGSNHYKMHFKCSMKCFGFVSRISK